MSATAYSLYIYIMYLCIDDALIPIIFCQGCQSGPHLPGVSLPCSIAQVDATALVSMAASVICISMESFRTWGLGLGLGLQALGQHRAPPDSGWATEWSQAASPAREASASRVTATQRGTGASPAAAIQAGRAHCVINKSTTHVMATSEWLCAVYNILHVKCQTPDLYYMTVYLS